MTQATTDDPTPIPTPLNVTALAKAHGVTRRTMQRRLKAGWVPPATTTRDKPAPPTATTSRPHVAPDVAGMSHPDVAPVSHASSHGLRALTVAAAVALAAVSGSFSVIGLTAIYAAAFWPVVAMGATLEAAKLVTAGWLCRRWC